MSKLYSDMTEHEIDQEIRTMSEKMRKAEQIGMVNEVAVYERKIAMAKSYLLDPSDFHKGDVYELVGDPGSQFEISYMNGIFAWGYRDKAEDLEAFPISLLRKV
ncbi:YfhH family protein [Pseudalkalibacillus berkeleyi]|uniref:YfhH family protein n=1 Tax=Pseudalkalibacillus berkeleyi TaxID=1069813 RepID=A0ABS9H691_9BACL|nr:YfhH family protein [Pseudalkalibacillus berkeleyi]MCF6139310.1 YfhH family protein [Pseudalkalibacillus berkeleyi]